MEFAAPQYAWLSLAVLALVVVRVRGERIRGERLRRFADPHLLPNLVPPERTVHRMARLALPPAVMLLLVLALMRPQWGVVQEEEERSGIDIIVALDLSRSMLADDVAPSRLAAAKAAVRKIIGAMPGDRIGIAGFAGNAFLLCPLTSDHEMVAQIIDDVGTQTLPKWGTALAPALAEAMRAFRGSRGGKALVVVTDGEDHEGDVAQAVKGARDAGVMIVGSLVGTSSGALMPTGNGGFVKDRSGAVVKSVANPESLRSLDSAAAPLSADGSEVVRRIAEVRRVAGETVRKERRRKLRERYAVPLSAALVLWLPGFFFSRRGEWL